MSEARRDMEGHADPMVSRRRYRLLSITRARPHQCADQAALEVLQDHVPFRDQVVPIMEISAALLPIADREAIDFLKTEDHREESDIPHHIEYEITVRRITRAIDPENPYGLDFGDWKDGQG